MFVEFAGLPGSGKTTLARVLTSGSDPGKRPCLSRDQAVYQSIRSRDDGRWMNLVKHLPIPVWRKFLGPEMALEEFITLSARHLDLMAFCTDQLAVSGMDLSLKTSIWRTIARSVIERELISTHMTAPATVVMDEAFFQRTFTLFAYMTPSPEISQINTYTALAPISETIFWINTPAGVCIQRLAERFRNRECPYDLGSRQLREDFERGRDILGHAAATLKQTGKQVVIIDGGTDLAASMEQIKTAALRSGKHRDRENA